jgi:hypothetical protein
VYLAVVFDLDGTRVQTEQLEPASYAEAAHELLPDLDPADVEKAFGEVAGRSRQEVASALLAKFDLEEVAKRRMADFGVGTPGKPKCSSGLGSMKISFRILMSCAAPAGPTTSKSWP